MLTFYGLKIHTSETNMLKELKNRMIQQVSTAYLLKKKLHSSNNVVITIYFDVHHYKLAVLFSSTLSKNN